MKELKTPDYEDFDAIAEMLGVIWSDKNYIKSLWDQYCSSITGLAALHEDTGSIHEELIEQDESRGLQLNTDHIINEILNTIQKKENEGTAAAVKEQIKWLEQQIATMNRIKGDIELSLRNTSTQHNAISICIT